MIKKKYDNRNSCILLVQGGAGDIACATPLIRCCKRLFPQDEIIVLTTYADIFKHNPNIDILIPLNDPEEVKDFYSEYVLTRNVRFFKKHFVYDAILDLPAQNCKTLPEFICNVYNIPYDGGPPEIFLTDYEKRKAATFLEQDSKPVILLHISGAVPSENMGRMLCGGCQGRGIGPDGNRCQMCGGSGQIIMKQKTNVLKDLDPQVLLPLVMKYKDKYNFLQIGLAGEPLVQDPKTGIGSIDCLDMSMRDTIALFQHKQVKTGIVIESLFMHAAAAVGKSVITIFQNTSPDFFGYPIHYNVWNSGGCEIHPCNRPVGALLDFSASPLSPKEKQHPLWFCKDQKCKFKDTEQLEKVFLEAVEGPPRADDGHNTLEAARQGKGPVKLSSKAKLPDLKSSSKLAVVKNDVVAQGVQQDQIRQPKKRGRKPKNVKQSKISTNKKNQ